MLLPPPLPFLPPPAKSRVWQLASKLPTTVPAVEAKPLDPAAPLWRRPWLDLNRLEVIGRKELKPCNVCSVFGSCLTVLRKTCCLLDHHDLKLAQNAVVMTPHDHQRFFVWKHERCYPWPEV